MLVDFVIIGAQKSATTLLADQFRRHPEVSFCHRKEPHYFSRESNWAENIDDYHGLYTQRPGHIYGEASTTYSRFPLYPHVPSVLRDYNPELKLIYVVRDPIERMKSAYMHSYAKGRVRIKIDEALLERSFFLNVSRYGVQIRWYLEQFPPEQLLLLTFEEVIGDAAGTWEKLSHHLGIANPDISTLNCGAKNAATDFQWTPHFRGKKALNRIIRKVPGLRRVRPPAFFVSEWGSRPELTLETQQALWRLLEEDVRFVEEYLGQEMSHWRERYT